MNNFYISISNGLLTPEHKERMGPAVWEFMWLLDKVTKIDSKGIGWVLGGKPINLCDVGLGSTDDTVSRNLHRLSNCGYIKIIRTPYGLSIRVFKAKKRFHKNTVSDLKKDALDTVKMSNLLRSRKNTVSNKTVSVGDNKYIVANATVWNFEEELERLRKSENRKDFQIIALYWKKKGWHFENKDQFNAALRRELKPAQSLKGYTGPQIASVIAYCMEKYPDIWTLETCFKRISDLVNKKQ